MTSIDVSQVPLSQKMGELWGNFSENGGTPLKASGSLFFQKVPQKFPLFFTNGEPLKSLFFNYVTSASSPFSPISLLFSYRETKRNTKSGVQTSVNCIFQTCIEGMQPQKRGNGGTE